MDHVRVEFEEELANDKTGAKESYSSHLEANGATRADLAPKHIGVLDEIEAFMDSLVWLWAYLWSII